MNKEAADIVNKQVFTTGDLSVLLGVAPATVSKWLDTGLIKGYRLPTGSRDRRFPREYVIAFCRQHGMHVAGLYEPEARGEEP